MEDEIIEIMREVLYLREDEISMKTKLDDIINDSMDIIELIAVLGNKYESSINPQEMDDIETVSDLVQYVKENKDSGRGESLEAF